LAAVSVCSLRHSSCTLERASLSFSPSGDTLRLLCGAFAFPWEHYHLHLRSPASGVTAPARGSRARGLKPNVWQTCNRDGWRQDATLFQFWARQGARLQQNGSIRTRRHAPACAPHVGTSKSCAYTGLL